jgi:hypothetical protein
MSNRELHEPAVIDLGKASLETKGAAGFEIDVSNGRLSYLTGAVGD